MADRLIALTFFVKGGAEVVLGVGVIRFEADSLLVVADRLIDSPLLI